MSPRFRPEVLAALAGHGLRPTDRTTPDVLRAALNDLYRYEIRRLRDACRAGVFPVRDLSPRVVELRSRYLLLSTPLAQWTVEPDTATSGEPGDATLPPWLDRTD